MLIIKKNGNKISIVINGFFHLKVLHEAKKETVQIMGKKKSPTPGTYLIGAR